jgi:iron complex outermembrane receptor protein
VNRHLPLRRRLAGAAALSLSSALLAQPVVAQPAETAPIAIPAAPLGDALRAFSVQTGIAVIFTETIVAGKRSSGVKSVHSTEAALAELLADTGLEAISRAGGYVIRRKTASPAAVSVNDGESAPAPQRVPPEPASEEEEDLRIDRVTVTGTSLRGIAPESSPLDIYLGEDILQSGVTTTQQFIRTLPQNFGGGSTEFVRSLPNDANTSSNTTSGTGVNLRGLGAGSTLTLLNGRRLAPSSAIGNFVDVSMIPLAAISRIEVLTDGASSIYGGDAVAGVVNFVMREDFEGFETALRYGRVTEGDMEEVRFSQTAGASWASGSVLATYEYFDRGALVLSDRPEILPYNQGSFGAIPTDFFDLSPEQRRHSLVVSGNLDVTDRLALTALGLYTDRTGSSVTISTSGSVRDAGQDARIASIGIGAEYELTPSWFVNVDGSYSEVDERNLSDFFTLTNPTVRQSEVDTQSTLWSADARINGDLLVLPGGLVKGALGASFRREDFLSGIKGAVGSRQGDRDVASVYAEVQVPIFGSDNALPGLERLELNLSGRFDDYSDFGTTTNPKLGVLWSPIQDLRLRGSYSTSFSPPTLGRVGALDRTGTVQRYSEVLRQFRVPPSDPALLGMNILRAFGTASSELEPETSTAFTAGAAYDFQRGNQDWSLSLNYYDIEYEGRLGRTPVPGNPPTTNLAPNIAIVDPSAFPAGAVIFNPTQQQVLAALATFTVPPTYLNGLTPTDTINIINNVDLIRNLAATTTSGIDARVGFETETRVGTLSAGLNGNYIVEFNRQAARISPVVEELNTLYNPIDLQLSGRLGLARDGFSGILAIQYKDRYRTDSSPDSEKVDSWTTFDFSLSYDFGRREGWLQDVRAGVSVLNLFDRMPPRTPVFGDFNLPGYDPTNASPVGRFVAIDVSKSF